MPADQPLVSVVMPLYNCERFVAEAVESALQQDYPAKEVIVVNDGSTDGSLRALERFGDAVQVLTVPNAGPANARNTGMRLAKGPLVAFLDADDVWHREKLSAQVAHMQANPETGVCYAPWHVWGANAEGGWTRPTGWDSPVGRPRATKGRSGWIYGELLMECQLLTTTVMLRKALFDTAGYFDASLPVGEDYDYWIRLSQHARIDRLDFTCALYRVVPRSASRQAYAVNHELEVLKHAVQRFGMVSPDGTVIDASKVQGRLRALEFQHAYAHLRTGNPRVAQAAFAAAIRKQPLKPKLWAYWAEALWRSSIDRPAGARP